MKNELKKYKRLTSEGNFSGFFSVFGHNLEVSSYMELCRTYGFQENLDKEYSVFLKEKRIIDKYKKIESVKEATEKLSLNNIVKKKNKSFTRENFLYLYKNKLLDSSLIDLLNKTDSWVINNFIDILLQVKLNHKKILGNRKVIREYVSIYNSYAGALIKLAEIKYEWKKDLNNFKGGKNTEKRIQELYQYLLDGYSIPNGAFNLIYKGEINTVIRLIQGESFKKAISTSIVYSKKRTKEILKLLQNNTLETAIRRSQIRWLAIEQYESAIIKISDFRKEGLEDLKKDFLEFLKKGEFFDSNLIDQLWDYTKENAINPKFNFKGRSFNNYLIGMETWHKELTGLKVEKDYKWDSLDYINHEETIGEYEDKKSRYTKEIISYGELFNEGKKQKHCIASYGSSCRNGNKSIISIREKDSTCKISILATFEINNHTKTIVQAKMKFNKQVNGICRKIIDRFARSNRLGVMI